MITTSEGARNHISHLDIPDTDCWLSEGSDQQEGWIPWSALDLFRVSIPDDDIDNILQILLLKDNVDGSMPDLRPL